MDFENIGPPNDNNNNNTIQSTDLAPATKDRTRSGNTNGRTASPARTLMATDRLNTTNTFLDLGLLSPPSSQLQLMDVELDVDASRMLISPPPEEMLRHGGRVSHTRSNSTNAQRHPFTPSLLANPSAAKRKRHVASHSNSTTTSSFTADPIQSIQPQQLPQFPDTAQQTEATPNPKPRKQSKRHARTLSVDMDSPTRPAPSPRGSTHRYTTPVISTTPTRPSQSPSKNKRTLLQSPHATNPVADFIPPLPVTSFSRKSFRSVRSATPSSGPVYEPPREVFTPPREVVLSPTIHSSRARKSEGRGKSTGNKGKEAKSGKKAKVKAKERALRVVVSIKSEPPDVDLTLPPPPASPTDDPLLLSGPIEVSSPVRSRARADGWVPYNARTPTQPGAQAEQVDNSPVDTLPPSSPIPDEDDDEEQREGEPVYFDWGLNQPQDSTDSMDLDDQVTGLPLFDLNDLPGSSGGWSDSDDEESDDGNKAGIVIGGEGEYTGRWRVVHVPTKADPPTSGTRNRMDRWGRPVSPFPGRKWDLGQEGVEEREEVLERDDDLYYNGRGDGVSIETYGEEVEMEDDTVRLVQDQAIDGEDQSFDEGLHQNRNDIREPERHDIPFDKDPDQSLEHERLLEGDKSRAQSLQQDVEVEVSPEVERGDVDIDADPSGIMDKVDSAEEELAPAAVDCAQEGESLEGEGDVSAQRADVTGGSFEFESGALESDQAPVREISVEQEEEEEEAVVYREISVALEDEEEQEEAMVYREVSVALEDDREWENEAGRRLEEEKDTEDIDRELSGEPESEDEGYQGYKGGALSFVSPSIPQSSQEEFRVEQSPLRRISPVPSSPIIRSLPHDSASAFLSLPQASPSVFRSPSHPSTTLDFVDGVHGSSSDDDESDGTDPEVVGITSADPRAAARAAAILKQHDYDCFTKIVLKQRRNSHSTLDSIQRGVRRKDVSASGIVKSGSVTRRRRTVGGVIGDQVFIPGSPAMTLPELLQEAEVGLEGHTGTPGEQSARDPFKTPLPVRYTEKASGLRQEVLRNSGEREWSREDWKQLDACFTDERLEVGARLGLQDRLAPVEEVECEDVVNRFVELMGGDVVINALGMTWTRDTLLKRVRALHNKQRSGNVAPPTTPYSSTPFDAARRQPSMEVPDFTPLGRRAFPPRKRPMLPPPVADSPFKDIPAEKPKVPASLLAPRYSHLLEEAISISQDNSSTTQPSSTSVSEIPPSTTLRPISAPPRPPTIGKRVKGYLFSYLPTISKAAPRAQKSNPPRNGLPLPPPEVLDKPRGPISTPVRPSAPKLAHPKELVHLQPAPQKVSMIPRATKPQRLVELHPLPPRPPTLPVIVPRGRRSSGGSVKDLVQSFEELEDCGAGERDAMKQLELKRIRSIGDWKKGSRTLERPTWKP